MAICITFGTHGKQHEPSWLYLFTLYPVGIEVTNTTQQETQLTLKIRVHLQTRRL
jgi:hypothetical protein